MPDNSQLKSGPNLQMRTEKLARLVLSDVLPLSMRGYPDITKLAELGGVIFLNDITQQLSLSLYYEPGNSVKVHLSNDDNSRPEGAKAIAFYHTHPYPKQYQLNGRTMTSAFDKFESEDRGVSDLYQVAGYLGVSDGSFWRFDPTPYDPERPTFVGPGTMTPLNARLPNHPVSARLTPEDLMTAVVALKKKYAKYSG